MKLRIEQDEDPIPPNDEADENAFLMASHRQFHVVPPGKRKREQFDIQDEFDAAI